MPAVFTDKNTWFGGFYELALEYGPHADALLEAALRALWDIPGLQGCYLLSNVEPAQQPRVAPTLAESIAAGHLRGIATLPDGKQVACGTVLVREGGEGSDWVDLYLPLGALGHVYEQVGAYPFEDDSSASREWREPLENWLAGIGQTVFAQAPFRFGLVGFEVSGTETWQDLSATGVPAPRWIGYLVPSQGKLTWYPTNQWQTLDLNAS